MANTTQDHFFGSVTVGDSGQVVIPKEAREAYGIQPGEKLIVFGKPGGGGLVMLKADAMKEFAKKILKSL
jgi:AbrB family looped-hinge helix DNA binding protein